MTSTNQYTEAEALGLELLRRHDGAERVPLLPYARFVAVSPAADEDEPAMVEIEWAPGSVEHPHPGSTLWRAALTNRLSEPAGDDPGETVIRAQIERSLARFPNLDTWWRWLRTGWTAPPKPDARGGKRRGRRYLPW